MLLFAEGEVWNNAAAIIVALGTLLTIILNWITNLVTAYWTYKKQVLLDKKLDDNTEICKSVVPAVIVKTDSAVQAAEEAKDAAERIITNASTKVGAMIGKALGEKADRHAAQVAEVAKETTTRVEEKIDKMSQAVKGEDGTCLHAKVIENTGKIANLEAEVGKIKNDVGAVKSDTAKILELLNHRGHGI